MRPVGETARNAMILTSELLRWEFVKKKKAGEGV